MLADKAAMATIAVSNIDKARKFYEYTLGLKPSKEMGQEVRIYQSGGSDIVVYRSEFAGTNKATSATWGLGSAFDSVVADLRKKSVTFEHYDMPGLTRQGDVHVAGTFKGAWLKDPDGNILHINNQ
jgi:catechol 2,3-dioxygenase-like lactoylglutathione lyase family enzyme